MPQRLSQFFLTIDIGGTKLLAAVVSSSGKIVSREHTATSAEEGPEAVLKKIVSALNLTREKARRLGFLPQAIGVAAAGAINVARGLVTSSPNLPGWKNILLRDILQQETGMETFLLNDASAAALGEHRFGAGRGTQHMVFITVSTGIGGGIIIDKKLYGGASGAAGEIGHTTIEVNGPLCPCGNRGCLEELASGRAIAQRARGRIQRGEKTLLLELAENKLENITAHLVYLAAQKEDSLSREIIYDAARFLGVGLANLVNLVNPEKIVVGGGVARMGEMLLAPARKVVAERAFPLLAQAVEIVPGKLGEDAGVMGAAAFILDSRRKKERQ